MLIYFLTWVTVLSSYVKLNIYLSSWGWNPNRNFPIVSLVYWALKGSVVYFPIDYQFVFLIITWVWCSYLGDYVQNFDILSADV